MNTTRASLILRIRDVEDRTAWAEFDAIYRPMLYRFGKTAGLDDADAEDVVQHCMTSICDHIHSFDYDPQRGRFKSWLRTLVNNRTRNLFRAKKAIQAETKDFQRPQDREPLPEDVFEKLWMEAHLRHALEIIKEETETDTFVAYQRYVMNGDPAEQVCEDLSMNRNQLYAIKFRVTRKLHERVKELLEGTLTN